MRINAEWVADSAKGIYSDILLGTKLEADNGNLL